MRGGGSMRVGGVNSAQIGLENRCSHAARLSPRRSNTAKRGIINAVDGGRIRAGGGAGCAAEGARALLLGAWARRSGGDSWPQAIGFFPTKWVGTDLGMRVNRHGPGEVSGGGDGLCRGGEL